MSAPRRGDDGDGFAGIDRGVAPAIDWDAGVAPLSADEMSEHLRRVFEEERRRTSCPCPACGAVAAARVRLAGDRVSALDASCYFCDWRGVILR